uniref:Uncharacterized protein n=1 Tax=Glossina austeni TaxID=7395 RepID=A0A1A9VRX7_GLOAU
MNVGFVPPVVFEILYIQYPITRSKESLNQLLKEHSQLDKVISSLVWGVCIRFSIWGLLVFIAQSSNSSVQFPIRRALHRCHSHRYITSSKKFGNISILSMCLTSPTLNPFIFANAGRGYSHVQILAQQSNQERSFP